MTFGERLIYARNQKGLNQKQFAELIGVTPTRLNYWEKDKREPDVSMIWKIIKALEVSGDWLIGNDNNFSGIKKSSDPAEAEAEKLTKGEHILIDNYRSLNDDGKIAAQDSVEALTYVPKYKKCSDSKELA